MVWGAPSEVVDEDMRNLVSSWNSLLIQRVGSRSRPSVFATLLYVVHIAFDCVCLVYLATIPNGQFNAFYLPFFCSLFNWTLCAIGVKCKTKALIIGFVVLNSALTSLAIFYCTMLLLMISAHHSQHGQLGALVFLIGADLAAALEMAVTFYVGWLGLH